MVQKYEDIIKISIKKPQEPENQKKVKNFEPKLETIFDNKLLNFDQIINIQETNKALKGYTKSYEISIKNDKDPLIQLQSTRKEIEIHIEKTLNEMKEADFETDSFGN